MVEKLLKAKVTPFEEALCSFGEEKHLKILIFLP